MAQLPAARPAPGFTLVELLVVVAVLSAVSLFAFGIVTEDKAQIRHDDTRHRLLQLRRAILGDSGPTTATAASGFVADNGDLPADIGTLLNAGTLLGKAVLTPLFDPAPGSDCSNNGGELASPFGDPADSGAQLLKGHHGDYLGGLGFNGRFRDGWGNVGQVDDAVNFGWAVVPGGATLSLSSLGADNAAGGTDHYASDTTQTIAANDWLLPLEGWSVTVVNRTGSDLVPQNLALSLLAFRNGNGGQWRRHSTAIANVCLDGDADGQCQGAVASDRQTFSFAAHCKAGDAGSPASIIPQGRHLLLLTAHNTGELWQAGSDAPFVHGGRRVLAQVDAVAGRPLPSMLLEIR
ncbi:MAG: prepilin-type N-terminal cleavage/methylation domain-containing protein [Dechloromonas sp.]|nr:MAG: prepilin-type N-terminal cleavage/methylation domain-containing protein [Dechloromonas sp.]